MSKNTAAAHRPLQGNKNLLYSLVIIAIAVIVLALYLITGQPTKSGNVTRTGWTFSRGAWYYYDFSGERLSGTQVIDGKTEIFDENGLWIQTVE